MFGNRLAKEDRESVYPDESLTRYGDPVLAAVDKKYKTAQKRLVSEHPQDAVETLILLDEALNLVVKKKSSLTLNQYLMVLHYQGRGQSIAGRDGAAVKTFELCDRIIRTGDMAGERLPRGLSVTGKASPAALGLVINQKDLGRARLYAGDFQGFVREFTTAARESLTTGDRPGAMNSVEFIIQTALQNKAPESGEIMTAMGDLIEEIHAGKEIPANHRMTLLQGRSFVALQGGDFQTALTLMNELIELRRAHKDPLLEGDLQIREYLIAQIEN